MVIAQTQSLQTTFKGELIRETQYVDYDGSPYYYEEWKTGQVTMVDDIVKENVQIKYDVFKDALMVIQNQAEMVVNENMIKSFTIITVGDDLKILNEKFIRLKGKRGYYLEIFNGENISVYRKYQRSILDVTTGGYGDYNKKKFDSQDQYYYFTEADGLKMFSLKKKELREIFGEKSEEVESYAKENKLKYKENSDVAAIFKYYDSIVK
jgi:hypothetical protein